MTHPHLATYLNDHLAGAASALELLARLERSQVAKRMAATLAELRREITADREELEALMHRLNIAISRPRQAIGWVAEKIGELKMQFDDRTDGGLGLLEGVEALRLGIEGKLALWRALVAVAETNPALD